MIDILYIARIFICNRLPSCEENRNADHLLAKKRFSAIIRDSPRFSAISRGFRAFLSFSMGFPVELPGWAGPIPAHARA